MNNFFLVLQILFGTSWLGLLLLTARLQIKNMRLKVELHQREYWHEKELSKLRQRL